MILFLLYVATIPAANWLITHWGTICTTSGPCVIPVCPGIYAPSGVLMVGAGLLLRDLVQRRFGAPIGLAAIAVGCIVSFFIAPPALALASTAAFALSELADFAVYSPLQKRRFVLAVGLSCAAGAVADSAVFLWMAFGSLDHLEGQVIGKLYAAIAYIAVKAASADRGWTTA